MATTPGAHEEQQPSAALFEALLGGDDSLASSLLAASSSRRDQVSHVGPLGFTSLHAAVAGGCAGALPALAAAGAPLDSELWADCHPAAPQGAPLRAFLLARGVGDSHAALKHLQRGRTALTLACW